MSKKIFFLLILLLPLNLITMQEQNGLPETRVDNSSSSKNSEHLLSHENQSNRTRRFHRALSSLSSFLYNYFGIATKEELHEELKPIRTTLEAALAQHQENVKKLQNEQKRLKELSNSANEGSKELAEFTQELAASVDKFEEEIKEFKLLQNQNLNSCLSKIYAEYSILLRGSKKIIKRHKAHVEELQLIRRMHRNIKFKQNKFRRKTLCQIRSVHDRLGKLEASNAAILERSLRLRERQKEMNSNFETNAKKTEELRLKFGRVKRKASAEIEAKNRIIFILTSNDPNLRGVSAGIAPLFRSRQI